MDAKQVLSGKKKHSDTLQGTTFSRVLVLPAGGTGLH